MLSRPGSAPGSDSQVRVDPFEEARELETGARRERQTRDALLAAEGDLWGALVATGRRSLGLEGDPPAVEVHPLQGTPRQQVQRDQGAHDQRRQEQPPRRPAGRDEA